MATGVQPEQKRRGRKRGDGEGSIRQRSDGLWRAEILLGRKSDGSPDRRYVYAKTRREAQDKLDALRRRAGDGMLADADKERATLGAFLSRWIEAAKTSVRPSTYKRYADLVRLHLTPALGHIRLSALKPDDVQRFYAEKLAQIDPKTKRLKYAPQTVFHMHRVLHRALEMGVKWGYTPRNVCDAVQAPSVPRREIIPPTPDEVARLLDAADAAGDPLASLWTLAALTGARAGELRGLQWQDVDLQGATLHIRRSVTAVKAGVPTYGQPKTPKSRRLVDLDADGVTVLRVHRDRQNFDRQRFGEAYAEHGLIFCTERGTALLAPEVSHKFKRALKRAGLRKSIRVHDLRHAAITMMLQAGEPVATVSEMVGHHSPAMTYGVYGHVIPGTKRQAAERLAGMIRKARQGTA